MCPDQKSEPTQSDTDCAPLAITYHLPEQVTGLGGVSLAKVKCPTCNKQTEQEWIKVAPEATMHVPMSEIDPMEMLKKAKRLSLCIECGTLRLTN